MTKHKCCILQRLWLRRRGSPHITSCVNACARFVQLPAQTHMLPQRLHAVCWLSLLRDSPWGEGRGGSLLRLLYARSYCQTKLHSKSRCFMVGPSVLSLLKLPLYHHDDCFLIQFNRKAQSANASLSQLSYIINLRSLRMATSRRCFLLLSFQSSGFPHATTMLCNSLYH